MNGMYAITDIAWSGRGSIYDGRTLLWRSHSRSPVFTSMVLNIPIFTKNKPRVTGRIAIRYRAAARTEGGTSA